MAEVTAPWVGSEQQDCAEPGCNRLAWLPRLEKLGLVWRCREHFAPPRKPVEEKV